MERQYSRPSPSAEVTFLNNPANGKLAMYEVKTLWRKWGYRNETQEHFFKLIVKKHEDMCVDIYWNYAGSSSCNLARWAKDVEYAAEGETESLQRTRKAFSIFSRKESRRFALGILVLNASPFGVFNSVAGTVDSFTP